MKQIESDKITILTGSNDSSKSLIQHKPEIGMSKESQLGLASYLKENKDTILHNSKSMCIITLRISCKRIRIYLYILKYGRI